MRRLLLRHGVKPGWRQPELFTLTREFDPSTACRPVYRSDSCLTSCSARKITSEPHAPYQNYGDPNVSGRQPGVGSRCGRLCCLTWLDEDLCCWTTSFSKFAVDCEIWT